MKIKTITRQHRRDFAAILVCEHCGNEDKLNTGYDDENYHNNVIPAMKCSACHKKAPMGTKPMTPKYPEGQVV